ncbi:MAG: hypothetical protein WDN76_07195 [Alphaproteobacteria bacterium]
MTVTGVLANKLAATVKNWIDSGEAVWDKNGPRPMHAGDVLVLVRKRGAVFEDVLRALKSVGLPVAGADRMIVAAEIAVEDLLALARVALDPEDDLSLACALRGPFIGLSEDDLMTLAAGRAKGVRLIESLRTSAHTQAKDYVEAIIKARDLAPYEFLARILEGVDKNGVSGWTKMFCASRLRRARPGGGIAGARANDRRARRAYPAAPDRRDRDRFSNRETRDGRRWRSRARDDGARRKGAGGAGGDSGGYDGRL